MTNLDKRTILKIGLSSAASWAWGTSLIMGQQIAQEKGSEAFWIWALVNALTLAVFAWLYNHKKIKPEIYKSKLVKSIAIVIQMFCLVVQLNFINQILMSLIDDSMVSYALTFIIGSIFILGMYGKGLRASIFTDVFQWIIAIITIFIILAVAIIQDAPHIQLAVSDGSDITWAVWSALVLLAGPIGDVQHWQRAESDNTGKGYYAGAVFFFMYMCLIYAMAHFEFNGLMNMILLITVLCITTSTIDSIAVAMHEMGNKKIGTIVCMAICVGWGLLASIGMVQLWSSFGVIRVVFAVGILILPLCAMRKYEIVMPTLVMTLVTITIFTALGSIGIDNVFGILCMITALAMVAYLFASLFKGTSTLLIKEVAT